MKKSYLKPAGTKDLREAGRVILTHGEVTGHCHEVLTDVHDAAWECAADVLYQAREGEVIPAMEYFEEPGTGRRILMVSRPCVLRHDEHSPVTLDPATPVQLRQGDVFLNPIGPGAWHVIRQSEYDPSEVRQVQD